MKFSQKPCCLAAFHVMDFRLLLLCNRPHGFIFPSLTGKAVFVPEAEIIS